MQIHPEPYQPILKLLSPYISLSSEYSYQFICSHFRSDIHVYHKRASIIISHNSLLSQIYIVSLQSPVDRSPETNHISKFNRPLNTLLAPDWAPTVFPWQFSPRSYYATLSIYIYFILQGAPPHPILYTTFHNYCLYMFLKHLFHCGENVRNALLKLNSNELQCVCNFLNECCVEINVSMAGNNVRNKFRLFQTVSDGI